MHISISKGNTKMGAIPSVSLPAGISCRTDCTCLKKCYALRLERRRKTVHNAYQRNYHVLKNSPETYWREVEASIMTARFFRFHVSGDIPDMDYLINMIRIAKRNKHCEIVCFTKKYELVNAYLAKHKSLPKNLHLTFSVWQGLNCPNPYNLPEAHVLYRDGTTTAGRNARLCGGNCTACAIGTTDGGCWTLKTGEQVVFHEH